MRWTMDGRKKRKELGKQETLECTHCIASERKANSGRKAAFVLIESEEKQEDETDIDRSHKQ
jgi:hypothetical protein